MHESPKHSWVASIRAVTLAAIVAASVVAGGVAFTGPAAASFQNAEATDVGVGLASTTQTISIDAQSPDGDGGTDYYTINVSSVVERGAAVTDVQFVDRDEDNDSSPTGASYNASTKRVTLKVTEGANDGDKQATFDVEVTYDTRQTTPKRQIAYNSIKQFDTPNSETWKGSANPQFSLYGAAASTVTASPNGSSASPANHSIQFDMVGKMAPKSITVETAGANYDSVRADDITEFSVGSTEASGQIDSVSGSGDTLTITLTDDQVMENADTVTLVIADAINPGSNATTHVEFENAAEGDRFEVDGQLAVTGDSSSGGGDDSTSGGSSGDDSDSSGGSSTTTTTTQSSSGGGGSGDDSSSGGGGSGGAGTGGSGGGSGSSGGGSGADTGGSGGGGGGGSGAADIGGSSDDDDSSSSNIGDTPTSTTTTTMTTTTDNFDDDDSDDVDMNSADTSTTSATTTTTTSADSPGFTAFAAVVALGAAILLVRRRP